MYQILKKYIAVVEHLVRIVRTTLGLKMSVVQPVYM